MKSVYSLFVYRLYICLGLLTLTIVRYFLKWDGLSFMTAYRIFYLVLMGFAYVLYKNRRHIERNEDEMVRFVIAKVNSIILTIVTIFLIALTFLMLNPYPSIIDIQISSKLLALIVVAFLCVMSSLRIILFKYYDGKAA